MVQALRASNGDRLLDWGAGYGHFSYVQQVLGAKVVAFTPPRDSYTEYVGLLEQLAGAGGFDVRVGDPRLGLPVEDASQDVVTSIGVLEHVAEGGDDEDRAVADIARTLRPGGVFFIAHLPQRSSAIEWLNRRLGRTHHQRLFTRRELRTLLARHGFCELSTSRYGLLPVNQLASSARGQAVSLKSSVRYREIDRHLCKGLGLFAQNLGATFQKQ